MNTLIKLTSVTLVALMLGTSLAAAGGIDGLNEAVAPTPSDSLQDAVQSSSPSDSVNDAVLFDPERDINDAVLAGSHPNKGGGKVTVNGRQLLIAFTCTVGRNDLLVLRNAGADVPAGTKVRWDVRAAQERGVVRLPSDLANGETVRVDTRTAIDAGLDCKAQAI